MIDDYAKQSLIWKRATSVNEYNEPTYSTSTIKGRKETGFKLIRNSKGEETVSSARVFTKSAVTEGDLIDDELVIAVTTAVDLDGKTGYYAVYLK